MKLLQILPIFSIRLSYVDWIFLNSVSRYFKLSYILIVRLEM